MHSCIAPAWEKEKELSIQGKKNPKRGDFIVSMLRVISGIKMYAAIQKENFNKVIAALLKIRIYRNYYEVRSSNRMSLKNISRYYVWSKDIELGML